MEIIVNQELQRRATTAGRRQVSGGDTGSRGGREQSPKSDYQTGYSVGYNVSVSAEKRCPPINVRRRGRPFRRGLQPLVPSRPPRYLEPPALCFCDYVRMKTNK